MTDLRGGINRTNDIDAFSESEVEKAVAYGRSEISSAVANRVVKIPEIAPDIAMSDIQSLQISADRIYSRDSVLGEGAFGKVYKGISSCVDLFLDVF